MRNFQMQRRDARVEISTIGASDGHALACFCLPTTKNKMLVPSPGQMPVCPCLLKSQIYRACHAQWALPIGHLCKILPMPGYFQMRKCLIWLLSYPQIYKRENAYLAMPIAQHKQKQRAITTLVFTQVLSFHDNNV